MPRPALDPARAPTPRTRTRPRTAIHCSSTGICDLEGGFFPGGTITVDVDAIGPDGISAWQLNVPGSSQGIYCKTEFREESGPQSWTCNIPAGNVTLHAFAPDEAQREYNLGLRW